MVLYAYNRGHKVSVYTTIIGMIFEDIDKLLSLKLKYFIIHLPSDNKDDSIFIDNTYITLLDTILKSKVPVTYIVQGGKVNRALVDKVTHYQTHSPSTRAGNSSVKCTPLRHKGVIGCKRNFMQNVLLPNGDVALCCMDYGLQHILGNLSGSDYESLFSGQAFLSVMEGCLDDTKEILCRYCDLFYR